MKFDSIINLSVGREIFIWGASNLGCAILDNCIKNNIQIKGFIDNNSSVWDTYIRGCKVFSSAVLKTYKISDKPFVIFSTNMVTTSLREQCTKLGYKEFEDYDIVDNQYSVMIDVVGACNLKCPSCPRGNYLFDRGPDTGIVSIGDFMVMIDKIKYEMPELMGISLFNWGEPFLHPNLGNLVEICNENDLFCVLSSNMSIEKNLDQVIKANPGWIKVSVSGYTQKIYETTHTGGNIELVKSNMYKLRYLIDKYSSDTIVEIGYHLYKNNDGGELESMRRLAEELKFVFKVVIAGDGVLEKLLDMDTGKDVSSELDDLLILGNVLPSTFHDGNVGNIKKCRYMRDNIVMNFDGAVTTCCRTFCKENYFENVNYKTTPIKEIMQKKLTAPICKQCIKNNRHQPI